MRAAAAVAVLSSSVCCEAEEKEVTIASALAVQSRHEWRDKKVKEKGRRRREEDREDREEAIEPLLPPRESCRRACVCQSACRELRTRGADERTSKAQLLRGKRVSFVVVRRTPDPLQLNRLSNGVPASA